MLDESIFVLKTFKVSEESCSRPEGEIADCLLLEAVAPELEQRDGCSATGQ